MTYGGANGSNTVLRPSTPRTPNDRCICKKHALEDHADPTPFESGGKFKDWTYNRLVPADLNEIKSQIKITWKDRNGVTRAEEWVNVGSIITVPSAAQPYEQPGSGESFSGWFTDPGGVRLNPGVTTAPSSDVVYKAEFQQTSYTIVFKNRDVSTDQPVSSPVYYTETVYYGNTISAPSTNPTPVNPVSGKIYNFSNWVLENTNKYLGIDITKAATGKKGIGAPGTYTFIACYDGTDVTDNNIKIFDNIGQLPVSGTTPPHDVPGDIGNFWSGSTAVPNGWYSLVHDGHNYDDSNGDVLSSDRGISPSETERQRMLGLQNKTYVARHKVTLDGTDYYSYVGDSIVYEYFDITQSHTSTPVVSGFKTSDSLVTSSDLLSEITFKDSSDNIILHIKSNDPWIKFAIIDVRQDLPNGTYINFADMDKYKNNPGSFTDNDIAHTEGIMVQAEIQYYIADNTTTDARRGIVEVQTPQGGYCTYVTDTSKRNTQYYEPPTGTGTHSLPNPWPFTSTGDDRNDNYMTKGNVYFYQLGTTYTDQL